MRSKLQNRFKSPVAITSIIVLILNQFGLKELLGLDESSIATIVDAVMTILITVGIINNPTAKDKF